MPEITVIIVSWNTRDILHDCLVSVCRHLPAEGRELVVVDNASEDGSAEMVAEQFPEARLVRNPANFGFGRAANQGMSVARGEFLLLLNSDALLLDDTLLALTRRLERDSTLGLVGPRIVLEDGRLQASARRFPSVGRLLLSELWLHRFLTRAAAAERLLGPYWAHDLEREADWLVGACLLLRREVFEQTGGFDPATFMYGEEVEWCRRIRARGWRIWFCPEARVLHLNHRSADRLFGDAGRIDRCLLAEDDLLRRWQGGWAPPAAGLLRLSGAVLRVALFGMRALLRPRDAYARDVAADGRATLAHYARRWRGTTWRPAG